MTQFKTLSEFKQANKDNGLHFFDRKTMSFFNSKIESSLLKGGYFITSEQIETSQGVEPRKYTLRKANEDATVTTVGEFQQFRTKTAAKEYIKTL
jgi:hypothetical protein